MVRRQHLKPDPFDLNDATREVLELTVNDLQRHGVILQSELAADLPLGISEITVKAHRGQVMRKMKADSLPDLVTMAARLGLPSVPAA